MATSAAVGRSVDRDAFTAGRDAGRKARDGISGGPVDLALVFSTTGYDQRELVRGVRAALGSARLTGCSGEGVITQGSSDECDHAVAVMAIRSGAMSFEPLLEQGYSADPSRCGAALARNIVSLGAEDVVGLLVFPDGLMGNCHQFLSALHEELPVPIQVAGGTAADTMSFSRTFQYSDDTVASDSIAAVLIRGRGRLEIAVSHGCSPIGRERRVTRGESGWVYEIDDQPAWSVFKEYLDGDPQDLNAEGIVHLCLGEPLDEEASEHYAPYVIHTPLRLDTENGALFFPGGGLETGQTIQLTRRDPTHIRESAQACADRILRHAQSAKPALVIQFDCAGRGRVLFGPDTVEEIVRPLQHTLGETTPWIGFHTYGEIAPIGGRPRYHNYTVALSALYDDS